jgi:hypothetical protein
MDEGCTQPLSSDPMINLNTTTFFLSFSPVCEESPQVGASRPYNVDHTRSTEVREEKQHTQDSKPQHNHEHKSQLELEVQHTVFATQVELKSLTQRIKCVESESRSLRMFLVSLCTSSMRLGVPFIAPRQLGAIGGQLGRPNLPSVGWCNGQSGVPPDSHYSCPLRDLLPFLAHPTVGPRGRLAHRTLSGAYRTVRCAQPAVAAGHTSPADCATDRWSWRPLAHRTVRCTTGQSGEL